MTISKLTPMMKQFLEIKKNYRDCIVFFRMGDFYEMFGDDAKIGSKILDITLTSRNKGESIPLPMCGVPYHTVDNYLTKLVKAGYKVALCDQLEDPQFAKGIVKRDVVRVVTPGTLITEHVLDEKANCYIAALVYEKSEKHFGLSFVDLTTGEYVSCILDHEEALHQYLASYQPRECLYAEECEEKYPDFFLALRRRHEDIYFFKQPNIYFSYEHARSVLLDHFGITSLHGFGIEENKLATTASGALLYYLQQTQKQTLPHLLGIRLLETLNYMTLDQHTIESLEIFTPLRATKKKATLLSVLDETMTAMGGRMLKKVLARPLTDVQEIRGRQRAVEYFLNHKDVLDETRELLKQIRDIERIVGRLATHRGTALDLRALVNSLLPLERLKYALSGVEKDTVLDTLQRELVTFPDLIALLDKALLPEPASMITKGGMIADGYHRDLDELRALQRDSREWINSFEATARKSTGISSLKVRHNQVFGYYIEITNTNLAKVPKEFIRKQTLVNAERFITPELKDYEAKVLGAEERIVTLELKIFQDLVDKVLAHLPSLQKNAEVLAYIDVLSSFAFLAQKYNYICPTVDESDVLLIRDGRHPVVEQCLPPRSFVSNDTALDSFCNQIVILTGPNMAGKSTYIRQVALLALMAQIGSFIPAKEAKIGIVDRIFTRIGSSDNVAEGQSTFMVEMQETAHILNNFTQRSLLVLDEVGRGTSTVDGLSIAWAIVEYLHEIGEKGPRTLFATHYHELISLAHTFPRVKNYNVAVHEEGRDIVFLHKIVEGGLDKSYGIHVAKLAGIPKPVLTRAEELLKRLSSPYQERLVTPKALDPSTIQMPLFTSQETDSHPFLDELETLNVNTLTPLDALMKLHEMKKRYSRI